MGMSLVNDGKSKKLLRDRLSVKKRGAASLPLEKDAAQKGNT